MSQGKKQPHENGAERAYAITTDRGPFWDGKPMQQGETIHAQPTDPDIIILLERGWIKEGAANG